MKTNELLEQTIARPKYKRVGILLAILVTLAGTGIVFAISAKDEPTKKENKIAEISLKNTDNSEPKKVGIAEDDNILNAPITAIASSILDTNDNSMNEQEKRQKDLEEQARLAPSRLNTQNNNINSLPNITASNIPNMQEVDLKANGENDPNLQTRKEKFASLKKSNYYLDSQIQEARSKFELKAGSVIPATMNHAISSDLPGDLSATVTQNVYDSVSGQYLLIPQGTKLNGRYDSQVAFGQQRIMVIWDRLVFANGQTFDLGAMSGADSTGKSGFTDKVNNHYFKTFGSAILVSIIGSGMQLSQPKGRSGTGNDAQEVITGNVAQQTGNTAQGVLNKTLNVQPTLEIDAGYTFNVAVNKDMVLE